MTTFNNNLPLSIFVQKQESHNKYILKIKNLELKCKSEKKLEVGEEYWALIQKENEIIIINQLLKKEKLNISPNALEILNNFFKPNFKIFLLKKIINSKDAINFEILFKILLNLNDGIFSIAFLYNGYKNLFECKKNTNHLEVYLILLNLPPLLFEIKNKKIIKINSHFQSLYKIGKIFNCEFEVKNFSRIQKEIKAKI